jgi:hypothetical protein
MSKKIELDDIKLDNIEYDVANLSVEARTALARLQFTATKTQELNKMLGLYLCAKNSYIGNLKKEMLSSKAGLQFGDD